MRSGPSRARSAFGGLDLLCRHAPRYAQRGATVREAGVYGGWSTGSLTRPGESCGQGDGARAGAENRVACRAIEQGLGAPGLEIGRSPGCDLGQAADALQPGQSHGADEQRPAALTIVPPHSAPAGTNRAPVDKRWRSCAGAASRADGVACEHTQPLRAVHTAIADGKLVSLAPAGR